MDYPVPSGQSRESFSQFDKEKRTDRWLTGLFSNNLYIYTIFPSACM
jgi:hypothetical protein